MLHLSTCKDHHQAPAYKNVLREKHFSLKCFYKRVPVDGFYKSKHVVSNLAMNVCQIIIVSFDGLFVYYYYYCCYYYVMIIIIVISPFLAVDYKDKVDEPHGNECSG